SVEKADIIRRDLGTTERIRLRGQEFAGLQHSLRRTIAIYIVLLYEVGHYILDPFWQYVIVVAWVTNVFPGNIQSEFFQLLSFLYVLADLIAKFFGSFA